MAVDCGLDRIYLMSFCMMAVIILGLCVLPVKLCMSVFFVFVCSKVTLLTRPQ